MPQPIHTRHADVESFFTKDGALVRELMHPVRNANHAQSLAEAIVEPGMTTLLHRHFATEELYHVTSGQGIMTLGENEFPIGTGDTVCIAAGTPHRVHNAGSEPLVILCCCAPPYSHADTELLEV